MGVEQKRKGGGETKILKRGGQARSRARCFKKGGGWEAETYGMFFILISTLKDTIYL